MVNSSHQLVLHVELLEEVKVTGEIVVKSDKQRGAASNRMASVSARAFNAEEAGRYAGSREDLARMAMNFAGVSGANDQRNDIVIRGNTPRPEPCHHV